MVETTTAKAFVREAAMDKFFEQLHEAAGRNGYAGHINNHLSGPKAMRGKLPGLTKAAETATMRIPDFSFFTELVPFINEQAAQHVSLPEPICHGKPGSIRMQRKEVLALLSAAFLCQIPAQEDNVGELCFLPLCVSTESLAVEKLVCLLAYFHNMSRPEYAGTMEDEVVFSCERLRADQLDWKQLGALPVTPMIACQPSPDVGSSMANPAMVAFTSTKIHDHAVNVSATQEEVIFSAHPECLPAILFCQTLLSNEALVVSNVLPHSRVSGYMGKFRFVETIPTPGASKVIVALDAKRQTDPTNTPQEQLVRDINKALCGFLGVRRLLGKDCVVASGCWGGGTFHSSPEIKLLEQVIAASVAGVSLLHCFPTSFGAHEATESLQTIVQLLQASRPPATIQQLLQAISLFHPEWGVPFAHHLANLLQNRGKPGWERQALLSPQTHNQTHQHPPTFSQHGTAGPPQHFSGQYSGHHQQPAPPAQTFLQHPFYAPHQATTWWQ